MRSLVYIDRDNGNIGFGNKYGERSFNQRPIHADPVLDRRSEHRSPDQEAE